MIDLEQFTQYLKDKQIAPSSVRTYTSLVKSLIKKGAALNDERPDMSQFTPSPKTQSSYRTSWNHLQDFLTATRLGGSMKITERALEDARVPEKFRPHCVGLHATVVEALQAAHVSFGRGTWLDVAKALASPKHERTSVRIIDAYVGAWPWLQAAHETNGLIALPDYVPVVMPTDRLLHYAVYAAVICKPATPWNFSWGDLTLMKGGGSYSHEVDGKRLFGDVMWELASRHRCDAEKLFFECVPAHKHVVVNEKGHPLDVKTWDHHAGLGPFQRGGGRFVPELPKEIAMRLNRDDRPKPFDMASLGADLTGLTPDDGSGQDG